MDAPVDSDAGNGREDDRMVKALLADYAVLDSSLVLAILGDCGHSEDLARAFLDPLRDESMAVQLSMEMNALDFGEPSDRTSAPAVTADALEREFALIKGELDREDMIDQYRIDTKSSTGDNVIYTPEEDEKYFADLSVEDADKLRFLHRSFPETSLGVLSLKLRLSESGNIDEIIDQVLSMPLLREEQVNQMQFDSEFHNTERKKNKKKAKLINTTTGTTTPTKPKSIKKTVIGLKYNSSNKAGSNYDDFQYFTQQNHIEESAIPPSQWQDFFSDIETLSKLLHMDSCLVASSYYRNSVSKIGTIVNLIDGVKLTPEDNKRFESFSKTALSESFDRVLLSLEASNNDGTGQFDLREARNRLTQIPSTIIERVYKAVNGDSDDLDAVLRILISDESAGSAGKSNLNDILVRSTLSGDFFNVLPALSPQSTPTPATKWEDNVRGTTTTSSDFTEVHAKETNPNRKSAKYLRNLALSHENSRNVAYSKAVEAHKMAKTNKLFGGASSYYSGLGSEHDRQRKALLTQAIDKEIARQTVQDFYTIDLHGYTVMQALDIVRERLNNWWTREMGRDRDSGSRWSAKGRIRPLTLITGVGYGSEGGVSKIKIAVKKMLKQDGWKFVENKVSLEVTGVTETQQRAL